MVFIDGMRMHPICGDFKRDIRLGSASKLRNAINSVAFAVGRKAIRSELNWALYNASASVIGVVGRVIAPILPFGYDPGGIRHDVAAYAMINSGDKHAAFIGRAFCEFDKYLNRDNPVRDKSAGPFLHLHASPILRYLKKHGLYLTMYVRQLKRINPRSYTCLYWMDQGFRTNNVPPQTY